MSRRPAADTHSLTRRAQSAPCATSALMNADFSSPATRLPFFSSMSTTKTRAPSSAKRFAMPVPKPLPAPVTMATLSLSLIGVPPQKNNYRINAMNLERVTPGRSIPNDVNVIIEIPMNADPVKYEVDKATGAVFVDRFMSTAMHYPCNYGYVPRTLSGDGDPVDVLVLSPYPLITGVVVRCRPVGMLRMKDEAGEDTKLLAVPIDKLTS